MNQNFSNKIGYYLRVIGKDILYMNILLLITLADKYYMGMAVKGMGHLKSRERFLKKNVELQNELARFYAKYHYLCPSCLGCCFIPQLPYLKLDLILYGIPNRPGFDYPVTDFLWYLKAFYLDAFLRWVPVGKPEVCQPEIAKEKRGSVCLGENGCTLPLGQRPIFCILGLCGSFLRNMAWSEYWRCMRLSIRYLVYLTVSLMAIMAEWRQQAGVPSAL